MGSGAFTNAAIEAKEAGILFHVTIELTGRFNELSSLPDRKEALKMAHDLGCAFNEKEDPVIDDTVAKKQAGRALNIVLATLDLTLPGK